MALIGCGATESASRHLSLGHPRAVGSQLVNLNAVQQLRTRHCDLPYYCAEVLVPGRQYDVGNSQQWTQGKSQVSVKEMANWRRNVCDN